MDDIKAIFKRFFCTLVMVLPANSQEQLHNDPNERHKNEAEHQRKQRDSYRKNIYYKIHRTILLHNCQTRADGDTRLLDEAEVLTVAIQGVPLEAPSKVFKIAADGLEWLRDETYLPLNVELSQPSQVS